MNTFLKEHTLMKSSSTKLMDSAEPFLLLTLKGFIKVSASFIFFFSPDGLFKAEPLFYICISSQYPSVCLYFILLRYGPNQCVSVGVPT